ncbi:hypothetical protein [Nocardiopsis lambiniae]|uniref:DUF3592 domain-containing protein n=1 Tax=Nocardiopsis lambiniae TaxID=3075539 RepID=A0ABU2MDK5_9ACTN|nr:hypothetical protein [Nocardiopsis sp. DSM 44743]MDT0330768.1 hypothetical protein [Nocardiopsis sp. DSM 44743]
MSARPDRRPAPTAADLSWLWWVPFLVAALALVTEFLSEWVVRWFAVVPRPARIVAVRDGDPVVLVDVGTGTPLEALAHGSHTSGDPVETTVRHVPFVPEAVVLGDHVSPWPFVVLTVLLCLGSLVVWAPWGLRAAWNLRRRRPPRSRRRPHRDRDRGTDLWGPVLSRAIPGAACAVGGALLGGWGLIRASVSGESPDLGALASLFAAWLLLPPGIVLALRALLRYADRAPVRVVPDRVRTLPPKVASTVLVLALILAALSLPAGFGWGAYREHRAMAVTETGTALVSEVRTRDDRGACRAEADLHHTVADLPYRTTIDVDCADVSHLRSERFVPVEWSVARPEHVRWIR